MKLPLSLNSRKRSVTNVINKIAVVAFLTVLGIWAFLLQHPLPVSAATWDRGDVFIGITPGTYKVYDNNGSFKEQISDNYGNFATGCAFDSSGNLYTTNYSWTKVIKYDGAPPHSILQIIDPYTITGDASTESIVFAANGDFYIGHATGTHRIRKYNAAGVFQQSYNVAVQNLGSDWLDLASDQQTIFYTSEGSSIKRYNVATGSQLADFATVGGQSYALRLLPSGGGLLVANKTSIKRLNSSGTIVQTYDAPNQDYWFALNLDPNGTSFWSADETTGNFYRFNITTGTIEVGPINASPYSVDGLCVRGEITSGQPTPTGTPTNTPTPTNTLTPTPACIVPTRTTFPWGCTTLPTVTASPYPPQIVKSYYVEPTRTPGPLSTATPVGWNGTWWEEGYAAAANAIANGGPKYGVAILDFGGPYWITSYGSEEPDSREWGTISIRTNIYYSLDDIKQAVGDFAAGFYKRSSQQFPIENRPHITATIGTSNFWFVNTPLSIGDFRQHV